MSGGIIPIILSDKRKNANTQYMGKFSIKKFGMSLISIIKVFNTKATTTIIAITERTLIKLLKTKEYKPDDL